MAKVLETSKDKLKLLLNVVDRVPPANLASELGKHLGFRKVIKVHLKDYLDELAGLKDLAGDKSRKLRSQIAPLEVELKKFKDAEVKDEIAIKALEDQMDKMNGEFKEWADKKTKEMDDKTADLKLAKVKVEFEDEDFVFERNIIKELATTMFKFKDMQGEDKMDLDAYEDIDDIFNSVK